MSRFVFRPPPVTPSGASVRIDTASGSTSKVTDYSLLSSDGSPILSTIPSDGVSGALPAFLGPDGTSTLYMKTLNSAGAVTATVTLTGLSAGSPPPSSTDLVAALVNGAPGSLDTLGEVATALAALPGAYEATVAAPTGVAATDSAALQAAHDTLPTGGGKIVLRAGTYALGTTGVTFSKKVRIVGAGGIDDVGGAGTLITYTGLTGAAITVAAHGCVFEDFALVNTNASDMTSGQGFLVTSGRFTRWNRVGVRNFWNNIEVANGFYWRMTECDIFSPVNYGLYMHNTSPSSDWGDAFIRGCVFTIMDTARSAVAAVRWESGGGVYFENNKINAGANPFGGTSGTWTTAIDFAAADGVGTSDIFVVGNSIESFTATGVSVTQKNTTGVLANIIITDNQFLPKLTSGVGVYMHAASGTSQNIAAGMIANNVFAACLNSVKLVCCMGITVGLNTHSLPLGPVIVLGDSAVAHSYPDSITVVTQALAKGTGNAPADSVDVITDYRGQGNNNTTNGTIEHDYAHAVHLTATTAVAYFTLEAGQRYKSPGAGGLLAVTLVGGTYSSGGPCMIEQMRSLVVSGATTVAVATVGTDIAVGPQATNVTITYDTSVVNKVTIKVAVSNASGANTFDGTLRIKFKGLLSNVRFGA